MTPFRAMHGNRVVVVVVIVVIEDNVCAVYVKANGGMDYTSITNLKYLGPQ